MSDTTSISLAGALKKFSLGAAFAFTALPPQAGAAYTPPVPSFEVKTMAETWRDSKRDRDVPVKIYYPVASDAPFPIVIFSHGLGGSRDGYEYFGRYLAGCGYVAVHVQHLGSDIALWRGKPLRDLQRQMQAAVADPENVRQRPADVHFAIDRMLELNARAGTPFTNRLDGKRIAVAGHSFGAWTALAVAGQTVKNESFADPRVQAAIAMSPPASIPAGQDASAYTGIAISVLHLTGTRDEGAVFGMRATDRRIPFDHASRAPGYLVIFDGATHMSFAEHPRSSSEEKRFHALIAPLSAAFLDACLRNNTAATTWLRSGAAGRWLGSAATFEKKP